MISLNLTAMTTEEIIIKDYLENNAGETLAEKINNGVRIEQDGKTLINKKTLEHFMDYAGKEAQKQAKQGARYVSVYKDAVFNWAAHFFEEDTIHGTLYNEDGTEYKPAAHVKPAKTTLAAPTPKPMDLFDMMATQEQQAKLAEFEENTANEPSEESEPTAPPEIESKPVNTDTATVPSFLTELFGDTLKIEV